MTTADVRQRFQAQQYMESIDYEIYHVLGQGANNVQLHHHDFYELYFLIEGRVSFQVEGRTYALEPGDIILTNSGELHQTIFHDPATPTERIMVWLNRSYLQSLSSESSDLALCLEGPRHPSVIRADSSRQKMVLNLLKRLLALKSYTGFGQDLYPRVYLTELLLILNNEIASTKRSTVKVHQNALIDSVIEYINRHIDQDIKIDDLTEVFFLSKFHLCREFKTQTSTTLHRYIIQKKLIHAKSLILQDLPITEVYQRAGFGDYSNFFRAFRNEYSLTPRQFYDRVSRIGENPV